MAGNQKLEIRITDMPEFVEVIDSLKEKLALWESATVNSEIRINAELLDKTQQVDRLEEEIHELKVAAKTSWEEQQAQEKHLDILEETIREQGERIKALEREKEQDHQLLGALLEVLKIEPMDLAIKAALMFQKKTNQNTGPKKTDG